MISSFYQTIFPHFQGMQSKRLKLRNGVLAELVEAIRFSIMNIDYLKTSTLTETIEKDISTIIKYSSNICLCCKKSCYKCREYYSLGITNNTPFQLCDKCKEKMKKCKHRIRGDYDCSFLYHSLPVLLYEKDKSADIIRFYKRMLLSDQIHQEFLLYSITRYLSFIGDYKQASSTLLKYNFSTSSTFDSSSESTHYIQLLRLLVLFYESQSNKKELSIKDYKTFSEAMDYAQRSESPLIHYIYLHCLLNINMDEILSTAYSFIEQHPQSSFPLFFFITILRYSLDHSLKAPFSIQQTLQSILPKYITSNPTSQSTLFDLYVLHLHEVIDDILFCTSLFQIIENLFITPPLQLFAMHLLCEELENNDNRSNPSIQKCIENNLWWIDYLDDSDLRIEYAKTILQGQNEEQDIDEDVVRFYEHQLQQYKDTYNYYLLTFWQ